MKSRILIGLVITLLFLNIGFIQAKDIPLSNCQEIHLSGNYYLIDDIWVSPDNDPCLDIYANGVTIDGRGHTIYGWSSIEELISINYVRNTVIKNIDLRYGAECINVVDSNETTITNSSFNCVDADIDIGSENAYFTGAYIYKNNLTGSESECINLLSGWNIQIFNNNLDCLQDGIWMIDVGNTRIYSNKISVEYSGIYLNSDLTGNIFFNNYLRSYWNTPLDMVTYNISVMLNIPKQLGKNIVGGPYLGGNYYTNYARTGYSDTCFDGNRDGICDRSYSINGSTDYYPLTKVNSFVPINIENS